ncbi:unnamed protein product [Arabidopsis thaliana]|uniref:Uncharacterized protein n=2 Tax=Arabidopsis thaliana TaxID=3702 RepID=A0A654EVS0_ARATH|nr:uncharacterized protein AT1G80315 [Arabidopsis thaliana]ANM58406.1 hypothetical protein AT1G80315 [Arabidopsis thaliana]CAA0344159.1 unnamed protein product [Arabidopsis thaliana]VYS51612.1 unnamed protein product [Arabidopsis thaliana]|eukprot:NP_001320843.1 hypothetical protein AT1G80315 [Arabidopsis thaliana]
MWNFEGPNLRSLKMDGSRMKQSTNPSANTISADGIEDRRRSLLRRDWLSLLEVSARSPSSASLSLPEPVDKMMKSRAARAKIRPSRPSQIRGEEEGLRVAVS